MKFGAKYFLSYNVNMRISKSEQQAIIKTFRQVFGDDGHIFLFGSRIHDNKKGGDIDLYIKTSQNLEPSKKLEKKLHFVSELMNQIGDQKIDLVINDNADDKLIYKVAEQEGIKLW